MNAAPSPSATGTSIPGRRCRRSRQAPRKNGAAEYRSAGNVSVRLAHSSSRRCFGSMPSTVMYVGSASIITCIIESKATAIRSSSARDSLRAYASRRAGSYGYAR